ncbi:hypothetical protein [Deinococcus soli (ex Cha et al. 2016)]|uniref:Uncharacterized protein n=2 Tax=Deinococcus soli (ex Cha et al. 2016) TaxID=1309411 RepID=A0AAE4BNI7_9DEIO|nr:hypothetical protein [Deinococcus soli (ex Cha et al. 2016)]MDR6218751.1 hypothetical protein [Deinococcus soli (ex Cha et al. 2016)]MDR6328548.1 hypothetical protein [Deinococcus soli (ex Cha et al. 2016)]MDR6753159.1 hypothetical protein [Deinococcus soli (ex Cha et al. 2016)]
MSELRGPSLEEVLRLLLDEARERDHVQAGWPGAHSALAALSAQREQLTPRHLQALLEHVRTDRLPVRAEPHNRWLPGEQGASGVYADDYCDGGYLWVHEDFQGDVHVSINTHPGPGLLSPTVRMAAHCVRRPHVITAARALARALVQPGDGA